MRKVCCLRVVACSVVALVSCESPATNTGARERPSEVRNVPPSQLVGKRFFGVVGPDAGDNPPRFAWTFAESKFTIEAGADPIARSLLDAILGADKSAKKIEGKWLIDGQNLILSDVIADGMPTGREARLVIFRTAPIRIEVPAGNSVNQYLFDP